MPALICTVRECARPLEPAQRALRCPGGHSFDRAREGYWNLLQPQDRRSAHPGDSARASEARRRWLERGFLSGLVDCVARLAALPALAPGAVVLDVGCGDGWFPERLLAGRGVDLCGIDLSTLAVRRAARRMPEATWVVANADRGLPLASASVDLAWSIHGRRPATELARVLRPGGRFVAATPAADDLAELREAIQGSAHERDRGASIVHELEAAGLRAIGREAWRTRALHDAPAILDALAMTYRGARHSESARLGEPRALEVTLASDVLAFVKI